ncbi:hypothetical protein NGTWS1803_27920 [Mycolicibacterium cyprinidarum]|nr:hypothetical protein NGTWS1803_27920 [Mycolicibacterium sp. NGTWS1803]
MIVQPHTRGELLALVDDRVDRLKSAGGQFDEGRLVEARGIAVHVRALVHHTEKSHALINQLGLQDELTWVDTAGVTHPQNPSSTACLTLMKIGGPHSHGEYVPKMDLYPPVPIRTRDGGRIDRGSRIPFDHWWTNPVVRDRDGLDYSRMQLVLALADDGEGGTHDDPEMKAAYDAVAASDWLGWVVSGRTISAAPAFETNPLMASVRQIGYEVVQSIRQQRDIIDAI